MSFTLSLTPKPPPRPRPPLGQELHDLDETLRMAEELDAPLNRRQLELLEDVARRMQRLHTRMRVGSPATQDERHI